MPSSFGFHRMSSSCARGATASGGVTFMRAASFLMPSTCFIACLLFACTNFHVSYKVCSALDPDKGTELELTVYTLTVHDGGVNQGLCAESKMSVETEADGACTEATLLSRARFATSPTVTRCESDSVAVVTLLVNWSLKKLLLGTR